MPAALRFLEGLLLGLPAPAATSALAVDPLHDAWLREHGIGRAAALRAFARG